MFFHILFTVFKGLLEMDGYVVDKKPTPESSGKDCCPEQCNNAKP